MEKRLGEDIPKLGFGLMRLPKKEDGTIDVPQVAEMTDLFLDAGFKYFDTAWAYAGSEEAIREALVERYPRESYYLASKNAAWIDCKTRDDAVKQFYTSLERTNAGYFDFYLLHNLGSPRTKFFDDFGMWDFVKEMKEKRLIRHIGFSFHSSPQELEQLLQNHPEVEFVQLQINYADWENIAVQSRANYEVARKYGKSVVIMEPVRGGALANPPDQVKKIFDEADPDASYPSWAIRFAADLDGLVTVLSGMSSVEQMKDNISVMKGFTHLSDKEREVIKRAREEFAKIPMIPCTSCNYCSKVCPQDIGISLSFTALNHLLVYNDMKEAKRKEWIIPNLHGKHRATECIKCGACEKVCPQEIHIRDELERVVQILCRD